MRIQKSNPSKGSDGYRPKFWQYDLAIALPDLVDSGINAKSSRVDVAFEPKVNDVVEKIRVDGTGMDIGALVIAMRPTTANPRDTRVSDDLGKFS